MIFWCVDKIGGITADWKMSVVHSLRVKCSTSLTSMEDMLSLSFITSDFSELLAVLCAKYVASGFSAEPLQRGVRRAERKFRATVYSLRDF